jgi:penicillin V acylase-like amidase (Ntn superfamily)
MKGFELKACSRLLWNSRKDIVLVGRTFDWYRSLESFLYINPRGQKMVGGAGRNSTNWTSKYGSITVSISKFLMKEGDFTPEDGATDGINEKGLAAHVLYLQKSKFIAKTKNLKSVGTLRWVRYVLDNYSTVDQAISGLNQINIVPSMLAGNPMNFHLAIEDATGDSAIIEFVNGRKVIRHGKQFVTLTNDPPYDQQIESLKDYQSFGGQKDIPGGVSSTDRFVRLSYYAQFLPRQSKKTDAYFQFLSVLHKAASPFGAPYANGMQFPTWWITIADLTNLKYFFESTESPRLIEIDLKRINFSAKSQMRWFDHKTNSNTKLIDGDFKRISTSKIESRK